MDSHIPVPRGGIRPHTLARLVRLIEERLQEPLKVEDLAREACLSPFHFARMFKVSTGLAPHAYLTARRMERARRLLAETDLTVLEVSRRTGFCTQAHFCSVFRAAVGTTPASYRRQQRVAPAAAVAEALAHAPAAAPAHAPAEAPAHADPATASSATHEQPQASGS